MIFAAVRQISAQFTQAKMRRLHIAAGVKTVIDRIVQTCPIAIQAILDASLHLRVRYNFGTRRVDGFPKLDKIHSH